LDAEGDGSTVEIGKTAEIGQEEQPEEEQPGSDAPRHFGLELARVWEKGELRVAEQQILQKLSAAHPIND